MQAQAAEGTDTGTYLYRGDWRGVDLSGANLENIELNFCGLQNAELGGVTQFSNTVLGRNALVGKQVYQQSSSRVPEYPFHTQHSNSVRTQQCHGDAGAI